MRYQNIIQAKKHAFMSLKIRRVCLPCSLLAGLLLFLQPVAGQYDFSGVDDFLQRNQKMLGNEVAAIIYKDGKEIYRKELGEFFNGRTQAPAGSTSKWFTAAVVMTFVDEGKLSLDDPVVKYIPVFRSYMKNYVTVRHCLTHTTGIENDKGKFTRVFKKKKFQSLEEEVKSIAEEEISDNPGKEFHYGDIGPILAARVIEVISKKSFDRLVQERIFRKLKMRSSTFVNYNGGAPDPSSGALSSPNDLVNFLSMFLNKGMFEGKRILSEEAIAEMNKTQYADLPVKSAPGMTTGMHHGLGTWIQDEDVSGKSTVICNPSLSGSWPYIDLCRNYAAVFFVKSQLKEPKKETALQFKDIVDEQIKGGCN